MNKINVSFLVPIFNEEKNIRYALNSIDWADEVFVIDSFSQDKTLDIVKEYPNVRVFQHKFENYAAQKNWALDNLPFSREWIFILDADESIIPSLKEEIIQIVNNHEIKENGFYVDRRFIFLGRWIKHCGWYPSWNLRLFRSGKARYEDRTVNEHMIIDGEIGYLKNDMLHDNHKGLFDWIEKHNKYSSWEAKELHESLCDKKKTGLRSSFFGSQVERKRMVRERILPKIHPPLIPLLRFFHMYFFKLGFLDGMSGFIFSVLQSVHEFHIAIKLKELKNSRNIFSKDKVKDYWDFQPCGVKYCPYMPAAKEFFEFTEKRRQTLEPFIKDLVKFNQWRNKKVLEIGCGIGIDTAEFARVGAEISAIDISSHSIELARKRLDFYSLLADINIGDAEHLDFSENYFDFVYSWGVLHHTPDIKKAVSEVFRVLKPGGEFCAMLYHKKSLVALQLYILYGLLKLKPFRKINEIFAHRLESPGTKAFTRSEVENLFSNFQNLTIQTVITPYDIRISRNLFLPSFFKNIIPKFFGFFLIITGKKSK